MREKTSFLDKEHTHLLEEIQELSMSDGATGESFKSLMSTFSAHLDREEETVMPLLEYLRNWASGNVQMEIDSVPTASRDFQKEYGTMIAEHKEISAMLNSIERSDSVRVRGVSDLIGELRHHVEIEEEILYPAALAAGELFKLRKPTS